MKNQPHKCYCWLLANIHTHKIYIYKTAYGMHAIVRFKKQQRCAWSKLFIPLAWDIIYTHHWIGTPHTISSSDSCILDSNYSSEIAVQVAHQGKKSESNIKRKRERENEDRRAKKKKENWTNLNKYALKSKVKMHHYYCYYPSEKYVNKLQIHFWIECSCWCSFLLIFENLSHFFRHFSPQFFLLLLLVSEIH